MYAFKQRAALRNVSVVALSFGSHDFLDEIESFVSNWTCWLNRIHQLLTCCFLCVFFNFV